MTDKIYSIYCETGKTYNLTLRVQSGYLTFRLENRDAPCEVYEVNNLSLPELHKRNKAYKQFDNVQRIADVIGKKLENGNFILKTNQSILKIKQTNEYDEEEFIPFEMPLIGSIPSTGGNNAELERLRRENENLRREIASLKNAPQPVVAAKPVVTQKVSQPPTQSGTSGSTVYIPGPQVYSANAPKTVTTTTYKPPTTTSYNPPSTTSYQPPQSTTISYKPVSVPQPKPAPVTSKPATVNKPKGQFKDPNGLLDEHGNVYVSLSHPGLINYIPEEVNNKPKGIYVTKGSIHLLDMSTPYKTGGTLISRINIAKDRKQNYARTLDDIERRYAPLKVQYDANIDRIFASGNITAQNKIFALDLMWQILRLFLEFKEVKNYDKVFKDINEATGYHPTPQEAAYLKEANDVFNGRIPFDQASRTSKLAHDFRDYIFKFFCDKNLRHFKEDEIKDIVKFKEDVTFLTF